jgi:hypothetical protein
MLTLGKTLTNPFLNVDYGLRNRLEDGTTRYYSRCRSTETKSNQRLIKRRHVNKICLPIDYGTHDSQQDKKKRHQPKST